MRATLSMSPSDTDTVTVLVSETRDGTVLYSMDVPAHTTLLQLRRRLMDEGLVNPSYVEGESMDTLRTALCGSWNRSYTWE